MNYLSYIRNEHEALYIYFLFLASMAMEQLGQFGNGPYKEYICGIYFELRPVVQEEIPFKIFLIYSSGSHIV